VITFLVATTHPPYAERSPGNEREREGTACSTHGSSG
jgi:hypothetical protein